MTPLYETHEDLSNEIKDVSQFMLAINEKSGNQYNLKKIDIVDGEVTLDYWVMDEELNSYVGVIEHKRRSYTFEKVCEMGGQMISKSKYDALMNWNNSGYKAVLVVRFLDILAYLPLSVPHDIKTGIGGRTDRGDPNDIREKVYFINPNNWKFITGAEL